MAYPPSRFRPTLNQMDDRLTPAGGLPDPTFGTNGIAPLTFSDGTFTPTAVAAQPDGAVVLAGGFWTAAGTQTDFAAVRYTPDGQLDPTFGTGGRAVVPVDYAGVASDTAAAVTVLPDGRIVLAGIAYTPGSQPRAGTVPPVYSTAAVAVVRLTAGGQPDGAFGTGGKVVLGGGTDGSGGDVLTYTSGVTGLAALSDGRVVVAGAATNTAGFTVPMVVRLTADGRPDPGFNAGSPVILDFGQALGGGWPAVAGEVATLPDGRVVMAGAFPTDDPAVRYAAVRLRPDGSLDPTFGAGGKAAVAGLPAEFRLAAQFTQVAVRPDGTALLGGNARTIFSVHVFNYGSWLVRLRPDGTQDDRFGGGLVTPSGATGDVQAVGLMPDGGVAAVYVPRVGIVSGTSTAVRLRADGSPDPSYGSGGAATVNVTNVAMVEPNGQVVTAGLATPGTTNTTPCVARLTGDPVPAAGSLLLGGSPDGTARLVVPGGDPAGAAVQFFPGFIGTVRTALADVTGDGVPDLIAGAGPGGGPNVVVRSGATGQVVADLNPFEGRFTGGVFVAAADLDGDGRAEVVVTPDRGGGPVVAIYGGAKLAAGQNADAQLTRFFGIDDPDFRGGARAAAGDVSGDGRPDLIVAAGFGGGPRVALFDGPGLFAQTLVAGLPPKLVPDFYAFEPSLRNGVFVAAGDLSGDGAAELVVGGGPGGGPRVTAFDGASLVQRQHVPVANFFAGDPDARGGVRVAVRPGADGLPRMVTGSGDGEAARVRVYTAAAARAGGPPEQELAPFGGAVLADGLSVG